MVRRDGYKYIVGEDAPAQLFDLAHDRDELVNLAGRPALCARERDFAAEVARRWDFAALRAQVIASQRRRRLAQRALAQDRETPWDYRPAPEAARHYIRNRGPEDTGLEDTERRARLPDRTKPLAESPDR